MFIIMILAVLLLLLYILFLKKQINNISNQLETHLLEETSQPITVELFDKNLNRVVFDLNNILKQADINRLKTIREEQQFKELIANISHDLRTPLTAIKGYQQLMQECDMEDNAREKLKIAMRHSDKLEKLITQFFKYSYYTSTDIEIEYEKFNLTNLVLDCLAQSAALFIEKGLRIKNEDQISIRADKKLVSHIISNLIENALFHSSGEVVVGIWADGSVTFENPLSHTIDVAKIFDRFYTGDNSRKENTGLGLSIVKVLTERMGGRVSATMEKYILEVSICFQLLK